MKDPSENVRIGNKFPPSHDGWESRHHLLRGKQYKIVSEFVDADGDLHPIGEEWVFLSSIFSKFDNEIVLYVQMIGGGEREITLRWRPDQQERVIENIDHYIH